MVQKTINIVLCNPELYYIVHNEYDPQHYYKIDRKITSYKYKFE